MNSYNDPMGILGSYMNASLDRFGAMRVVVDPEMIEQFRKPRSKSKRIQKKWRKDPNNYNPARYTLVDQRLGIIYCHPVLAQELRRTIK